MSVAQVVKWGNSLAVRIPKPVAEAARVKEGDAIIMEATRGRIELRSEESVPTLQELVRQMTPENRYDEIPAGRERGKERVEW